MTVVTRCAYGDLVPPGQASLSGHPTQPPMCGTVQYPARTSGIPEGPSGGEAIEAEETDVVVGLTVPR
jgi:hypothetical protein